MKIRKRVTQLLQLGLACLLPMAYGQTASGAMIVRFDAANYNGVAGGTVDVTLLLEATNDTASGGVDHTALFAPGGNDGLFSLGIMVMNDNFAGAAQVADASDIAVNTAVFDDDGTALGTPGINFTSVGANTANLQAATADIIEGVQIPVPAAGPYIVEVATLTYTLGPTIGTVTNLFLADFDTTLDDWNSVDGQIFDSIVDFNATATITAVPEPSGISAMLFGGLWMLTRRRRRKS
ncbi:MAG: PEP-CTERM sorting domain-containing protein [Pirellulaceae bacterium]